MKKDAMRLVDYNMLAYEFAVRNPRVIQLLAMNITDNKVVKELKTYGFTVDDIDGYHPLNQYSFEHDHLQDLKLPSFEPCTYSNEELNWEHYYKVLSNPNRGGFKQEEDSIDAIRRIGELIETRGGKLTRLINGKAFKHYDAVTFFGETVHSLDSTKNTSKTIYSDIEFIKKWIEPKMYLQLLPQYNHYF